MRHINASRIQFARMRRSGGTLQRLVTVCDITPVLAETVCGEPVVLIPAGVNHAVIWFFCGGWQGIYDFIP